MLHLGLWCTSQWSVWGDKVCVQAFCLVAFVSLSLDARFFQHHLLKIHFFPRWIALALLLKINSITMKRSQGSMKKCLIPQLRQKTQDEPGPSCAATEEALQKGWGVSEDTEPTCSSWRPQLDQLEQRSKQQSWPGNSESKMNIRESILI